MLCVSQITAGLLLLFLIYPLIWENCRQSRYKNPKFRRIIKTCTLVSGVYSFQMRVSCMGTWRMNKREEGWEEGVENMERIKKLRMDISKKAIIRGRYCSCSCMYSWDLSSGSTDACCYPERSTRTNCQTLVRWMGYKGHTTISVL